MRAFFPSATSTSGSWRCVYVLRRKNFCRLRNFLCLCFRIFLRRFLRTLDMQAPERLADDRTVDQASRTPRPIWRHLMTRKNPMTGNISPPAVSSE
jgi:hypothetical protein